MFPLSKYSKVILTNINKKLIIQNYKDHFHHTSVNFVIPEQTFLSGIKTISVYKG